MVVSREQIDAIIEYLDDTNETIADAVEAVIGDFHGDDVLTDSQKEEIFSRTFACSNCGYWFSCEFENVVDKDGKKCDDCVSSGMDEQEDY